jgi:serine protease Do
VVELSKKGERARTTESSNSSLRFSRYLALFVGCICSILPFTLFANLPQLMQGPGPAMPDSPTSDQNSLPPQELSKAIGATVRRIFEERKLSIVRVEAIDKRGKLYGTGFFADPFGTICTLSSLVNGATSLVVIQNNERIPARLLTSDPRSGLALIKVNRHGPFIPVGNVSKLQLGDPLLTIGYPLNFQETPAFGVIASFDHRWNNSYFATMHIRANAPIQRGFGGAPVLNMNGETIGVIVSSIEGNSGCYILPITAMDKIWGDFERFEEIRHGWIGVLVKEAEQPIAGSTAVVSGLEPDTPAASCGLKRGDVIIRINQTKVKTIEDVLDASFFLTAGDAVQIVIMRDGKQLILEVRPAPYPHASPTYQTYRLDLRTSPPLQNNF